MDQPGVFPCLHGLRRDRCPSGKGDSVWMEQPSAVKGCSCSLVGIRMAIYVGLVWAGTAEREALRGRNALAAGRSGASGLVAVAP